MSTNTPITNLSTPTDIAADTVESDKMERHETSTKDEKKQVNDNDVLFIKDSVVKKLLNWNDCVNAMESALVAMTSDIDKSSDVPYSSQTPRTLTIVDNKGVLLSMPGYASNYTLRTVTGNEQRHSTLACKLVTSFSGNSQLNTPLPTILATILLFDPNTGKLKVVVDGTDITTWRTAAVSVVATKYLFYRKEFREKTLAILGTGTQGRIHALAMLNYFPDVFNRIKLWNRTRSRAEQLRNELNELFPEIDIVIASTSAECVIGADCIVTATNSSQPLFGLKDLKENVHINAIGAGTNHHSELPMDVYQYGDVYIESNVGIQTELKGIEQNIDGEIGEIIIGRKQHPKTVNVTVFQSMGNAIEDGVMANLIYQKFIKL